MCCLMSYSVWQDWFSFNFILLVPWKHFQAVKCPPVQVCRMKFNKFTSQMLMLLQQRKDLKVSTVLFSQEMPPFYLQVDSQMTFSVYFNVVCVKFCFTVNSLLTLWLNTYNTWYLNCKKMYSYYVKIWICIHSLCVLCVGVCVGVFVSARSDASTPNMLSCFAQENLILKCTEKLFSPCCSAYQDSTLKCHAMCMWVCVWVFVC